VVELGRHDRARTNLWNYASVNALRGRRRKNLELHPTVEPTQPVANALQEVTRRGDLVLSKFLGSGTTLIAAERTGRRFRGCDIDPANVDAAIERWVTMTGGPNLLGDVGSPIRRGEMGSESGRSPARQDKYLAISP
jgi:DNA modification methylase